MFAKATGVTFRATKSLVRFAFLKRFHRTVCMYNRNGSHYLSPQPSDIEYAW